MKQENPLLSVIVPIYNQEQYLEKCLLSIVQQSYKNLDIILVNDGSTDGSADICDGFLLCDERITVIHKKNAGLVSARKTGICVAKGDYAVYVDGDDWLDLDVFEKLYQDGMQFDVDMVGLRGCIKEYENGTSSEVVIQFKTGIYRSKELETDIFPYMISTTVFYEENLMFSLCTYAIKRDLLKKNQLYVDNSIKIGEDFVCIWSCLLSTNSIAFTDVIGYHYRQHGRSMTHSFIDGEVNSIKSWYFMLRKKSEENRVSEILLRQLDIYVVYRMLLTDCSIFLKKFNYMFPYSQVRRGDKIIIYGAGILGQKLRKALSEIEFCDVVLWVDEAFKMYRKLGLCITSPEEIVVNEYKYIVVAVIKHKVSMEIKKTLQEKYKVPENKIALIDASKIRYGVLDDELRR